MKTLLSVLKTLIQINIATAFVSLLVFAAMREQQAQGTAHKQVKSGTTQSYHTALKAKTSAEQALLETSYERIAQHEQQIKQLEGELETYKIQVKDLLVDKNGQVSASPATANSPFAGVKNPLAAGMSVPSSLLDQIVRSGQKEPSAQTPNGTVPPSPSFRLLESSSRINVEKSFAPIAIPKNSSRERKIISTENSQLQSAVPPNQTVSALPPSSTSSVSVVPTARVQPSPSEITLDSRALFPAQSSQKPLDSFVTPNKIDSKRKSEIINRAALIAQQLSRTANSGTPDNLRPNEPIRHANDIVVGLMIAGENGQINYGTKTYKKVQTAIRLLRRGETLDDAARRSTLPPSVLKQLIKWGENRPGSLAELSEISQASPNLK